MKLLLVRHGVAQDIGEAGGSDESRRLTEEGRTKFKESARGLASLLDPPAAILTSPLVRARETAEILSDAWGGPKPRLAPALAWGTFEHLADELPAGSGGADSPLIALVGHEPHLSGLLATLLGAKRSAALAFKKGGAALVETEHFSPGAARILFLLPPRVSRALARD